MERPFAPDFKNAIIATLGAAGAALYDLGECSTGRTVRVVNTGAGLLMVAAHTANAQKASATYGLPIPVAGAAGSVEHFYIDANQRYLSVFSTAGTSFGVNVGQGG